ncbi:hypothetical protein LXA43DRAFT_197635 [Ganoderma leucocontextum]|nr:hypothetical protein LXA43DRAFT_197635 [Ganoderma leucocontextum]
MSIGPCIMHNDTIKRRPSDSQSTVAPTPTVTISEYWSQSPPDVLCQEISQRLARPGAKEEVVKAISRERLEFKNLWNCSLPINQLPYELLVHVFTFILCKTVTMTDWEIPWFDMRLWRLMGVCRHWRDVVITTPALWCTVDLDKHTNWINLCLSRSLTTPIDIHARVPDLRYRTGLRIAYPLLHRIRSLDFDLYGPVDDREGGMLATLRLLFSDRIPALEKLRFNIDPQLRDIYYTPTDIELTSRRLPCLQRLIFIGMVAPRDTSLYTQLRTLSLTASPHNLSFNHFLDVLGSCTRLEDLHLESTLHRLSGDWMQGDPSPRRPLISHPRLERFIISGHGAVCTSRFLAHFHIHSSVCLKISADIGDNEVGTPDPGPDGARSVAAMLPPSHAVDLEPLAAGNGIVMCMFAPHGRISINATRSPPHAAWMVGTAFLSIGGQSGPSRGSVSDLIEVFGRCPVTSLSVNQIRPDAVALWTNVFCTFPLLERLDVSGYCEDDCGPAIENVFLGLHAASTADSASSLVACPNLRHVRAQGVGTTAVYEAIRTCVRYRGDKGVVLVELELDLFDGSDVCSAMRRACIKDSLHGTMGLKVYDGE